MIKITLFSALVALFTLPTIASAATTADLEAGPNSTWQAVLTLTTAADDGVMSQGQQAFEMNVTALPAGANYRVARTVLNGQWDFGNAQPLYFGINSEIVPAQTYNRTVKIQFSSNAIEFDALTVNGDDAMPGGAIGAPGNGQPISASGNYFDEGASVNWPAVHTLTTEADGIASQGAQSLVMNVTYIPEGGANYRVYKTTANGNDYYAPAVAISDIGQLSIPVSAVTFDRTVKIQFSNDAVEFDALDANGTTLWPVDTSGVLTDISSQGGVFDSITPEPDDLDPTWLSVATLTTTAEGAASQAAQTLVINVTSLPVDGANYRVYKTLVEGDYMGNAQALYLGINTITVPSVGFDRSVKIQFDSDAFGFNTLTVNGQALWPIDTSGNKVTLANSNLFNSGSDETYVTALTTAVRQDGTPSQSAQTVELYITSLPEGGANYRVYKTINANADPDFGDAQTLYLGLNTITVNALGATAFDRAVKIQFDSDAIEFKALSVNGVARVIGANVTEAPSVSIDSTTLSWSETDGTTLQFSDDLESWTSLPTATSPYTPTMNNNNSDGFYRTISDE